MDFKENLVGMILSLSKTGYDFFLDSFVWIIAGLGIYFLISILIMKPYAKKRAVRGIGGNVVVKGDPLLIILPVLCALAFSACWLMVTITNP